MRNVTDIAHEAVARNMNGENITPRTITAELIGEGATDMQAIATTKMVVALIPTVTRESLTQWLNSQGA